MPAAIGGNGWLVALMIDEGSIAVLGAPQPIDTPAKHAASTVQITYNMIAVLNRDGTVRNTLEIRLGNETATGEVVAE